VGRIARFGMASLAALGERRVQLGLSCRVTTAAVLALAVAEYVHLRLPLWAVLTAMIVTQLSVGRSLKAIVDYMAGTIGGAALGGIVATLVPHAHEPALPAVLAIAVAPLAFLAAINPILNVAPVTAAIVILVPLMTHGSPAASAIDRVQEVAVGAATGFVVSFLVLPLKAHDLVARTAAELLDRIARALTELLVGLPRGLDVDALHHIQDRIGHGVEDLSRICDEAEHERTARLASEINPMPLSRTVLRLRHDLMMIGRAATVPLPDPYRFALIDPLARINEAVVDYLQACGTALLARQRAPSCGPMESAFDAYGGAITDIRARDDAQPLSLDAAERVFTLGFAFEQMRRNLQDLERCVNEWRKSTGDRNGSAAAPLRDQ
jgi:uncharacterized membrane protein YccC